MIDKNEMRIGNYFLINGVTVCLSEIRHLKELKEWNYEGWSENEHKRFSINFFYAEPIVLTPEILHKCGFEEMEFGWFSIAYFTDCDLSAEKMQIQYNFKSGRCSIIDTDSDGSSPMTGKCFYNLHQLQNLYHSITNEEIKLNQ